DETEVADEKTVKTRGSAIARLLGMGKPEQEQLDEDSTGERDGSAIDRLLKNTEAETAEKAAAKDAPDEVPTEDDATAEAENPAVPPPPPEETTTPERMPKRGPELNVKQGKAGESAQVPGCGDYELPSVKMLTQGKESAGEDREEIFRAREILQQTLESFDIPGEVTGYTTGPRVTRFEITLAPGVNVKKVEQIENNIAMNLAATSVRVLAPIPGRPVVGVEVSNTKSEAVFMRSVMESEAWQNGKADIPIALGKDVSGKPVVVDLAKAPHLLVAGATGTGKSVCTNSLIMSLLFHFSPDDLKLIMVDPKIVEFEDYRNLPHLLAPLINDSSKVPVALRWVANEMDRRYGLMAKVHVKKLVEFNHRPPDPEPVYDDDGNEIPPKMPYLVVVIDELADLMMTEAKKDVETNLTRIAQKGRAAGIHIVVATQRPSTNIITGVIKANLPTRFCFQVRSGVDSRVVLDTVGAEKLKWAARFARENGLILHTHLAETHTEVDNCVRDHGMRPVAYLDSLGLLGPDTVVAHCVHVNDEEADLLAERQVTITHCPCSNMKLGSGIFPYARLITAGCRITLGTDGASSSNNLDLREAMKFAALLAKVGGDPQLLPATQVFDWATRCGAEAFGIDGGVIAEGKLADCILVDLDNVKMQPCHNLISNFVYSA
ncbi:MAG: amidohydrolase family protein, partial [Lentisphaeria bacterium]|nr:amidohydrolase family protein [Lentisphaeria bacterium]